MVMGDYSGQVKWITPSSSLVDYQYGEKEVEPKYSLIGESIRHVTPPNLMCSMFCGGKQCKYCNASKFKSHEMAIRGLFSTWITDEILATSRPTSMAIEEYNIIKQFHECGIASIINLQLDGEHPACGPGLEKSGFSYLPQVFMDNSVFFYNFGWNDYGVRSLQSILDMVKVMDFAISKGKVAVHCHAGLGRTGVLIACYLIYSKRLSSKQAIMTVRNVRPKAIQTRGQINCVKEFEHFIRPMWKRFTERGDNPMSLAKFMNYQRAMLHGEQGRILKYVPKIVLVVCQQLLNLANIDFDLSSVLQITRFTFMISSTFKDTKCEFEQIVSKSKIVNSDAECSNKNTEKYKKENTYQNAELESSIETCLRNVNTEKEDVQKEIKSNDEDKDQLHDKCNMMNPALVSSGLKKGGIFLDPIEVHHKSKHKNKKKKRNRGILDKMNDKGIEAQNSSEVENKGEEMIDFAVENNELNEYSSFTSTDEILQEDYEEKEDVIIPKPLLKPSASKLFDEMSVSSFSSTTNEGLSPIDLVLKHMSYRSSEIYVVNQIERYKKKLNFGDDVWLELNQETNPAVLSSLLWSWFACLESPIAGDDVVVDMMLHLDSPELCFGKFSHDLHKLLECFITLIWKLNGNRDLELRILRRFSILVTGESIPPTSGNELLSIDQYKERNNGVVFFSFVTQWLNVLRSNDDKRRVES